MGLLLQIQNQNQIQNSKTKKLREREREKERLRFSLRQPWLKLGYAKICEIEQEALILLETTRYINDSDKCVKLGFCVFFFFEVVFVYWAWSILGSISNKAHIFFSSNLIFWKAIFLTK